jgi:hypothetical protein
MFVPVDGPDATGLAPQGAVGYERAMTPDRFTVHAPEFRDGLDWIGTDRPLRLADLRGKLVLLDFWTYG